jgi:glycosyltransferase involved in cell wall biosynthesis
MEAVVAMDHEPLVSAIIIFLNGEKYLEQAIQSVFAQTYPNWELILCDDGSTDGSTRIAREWSQRDPERVRYCEHEGHVNRGMSATRNLGIRHSRADLIAWLDADDVWVPRKLSRQVELLQANPTAAMIYGPMRWWYSWSGKQPDRRRDFTQKTTVPWDALICPPKLLCAFLRDDMDIPGGVLVQKSALNEVGNYDESFRDEFEDVIVHAKICLKYPAYFAAECWYKYRQHEDSCCAQTRRTGRGRARRLFYYRRLESYMREHGCEGSEAWKVLQEQMAPYRHRIRFWASELAQGARSSGKRVALRLLPESWVAPLRRVRHWRKKNPPRGCVRFGGLRRTKPISAEFGWDRGLPVDRHYIEQFLARHSRDIRGRVLEVGDHFYTELFGGDRVTHSDVLHAKPGNPDATIVGDLCTGKNIPIDAYDCLVLTQVFPFLYDFESAIANAARALKPGGVMLATFAGISQISRYDAERWGDFWRFTSISARRLLQQQFLDSNIEIVTFGNVLTATALLHGISTEELKTDELDYHDPDYEMIIGVRAVRPLNGTELEQEESARNHRSAGTGSV